MAILGTYSPNLTIYTKMDFYTNKQIYFYFYILKFTFTELHKLITYKSQTKLIIFQVHWEIKIITFVSTACTPQID